MLGTMPLVSMSERRLGGIANSSFPCRSAIRRLAFSTSRMVKPNWSRKRRRFCPAEIIIETSSQPLWSQPTAQMPLKLHYVYTNFPGVLQSNCSFSVTRSARHLSLLGPPDDRPPFSGETRSTACRTAHVVCSNFVTKSFLQKRPDNPH